MWYCWLPEKTVELLKIQIPPGLLVALCGFLSNLPGPTAAEYTQA